MTARCTRGIAATVAALAVAAGCGIPTDDEPMLADAESVPYGLLDPTAPTTSTTEAASPEPATRPTRTVCLFDDDLLVEVAAPARAGDGIGAVVDVLAQPPDEAGGGDLTTAVAETSIVASVRVVAGVADVDLAEEFAAAPTVEQRRIIEQLVCSLTAQPGIGRVSFSLAGQPIEVPTADGSLTAQPVSRDDYVGRIG